MVALGRGLGDDGRSLVSLEPATSAQAADDHHRARRLRRHLVGGALRAPLRVARHRGPAPPARPHPHPRRAPADPAEPAAHGRPVEEGARRRCASRCGAPIVVTGLGRSGTTLLHELLACDPDNRPPLLWELLHTVPYDDASGDLCDDEITLMDEMVPAFTAMHENGGRLPTECIFAFAHQFSSDMYTGLYNVAEYTMWRSGIDQTPIYDWHKRHLQTLQWVAERPTPRWVVKAPSHLSALPLVFATYPDATRGDHPPRPAPGHRIAGRPHGDAALHALGPGRPRRPGRVHGDGARACRWTTSRPSGTPAPSRRTRSPTSSTATWWRTRWPWSRALPRLGPAGHRSGSAPRWRRTWPPATRPRPGGHDYSFADTGLDLADPPGPGRPLPGALRRALGGLRTPSSWSDHPAGPGGVDRSANSSTGTRRARRVRRAVGQHPAHQHVALEAPARVEPVLDAGTRIGRAR